MTTVCILSLLFLDSSCINDVSCVSHDLEERKPCCRSYRMLLLSRCFMRLLAMMCSMILESIHVQVNEIGL